MNCREFSEHVTEIARGAVMDAAARSTALGHTEGCAACAARLERERALTAALRATAESFDDAAAPARVEAALVAAFRAARVERAEPAAAVRPFAPAAQTVTPAATGGNVRTFATRFGRRARVAAAAAAIAASLIVTFAVVKRPQPAAPAEQLAGAQSPATSQQSPAAQTAGVPSSSQNNAPPSSQDAALASSQNDGAQSSAAGGEDARRLNDGTRGARPAPRVERAAGGSSVKKGVKEPGLAFNIDGGQAVFAEVEAVAAASEVASLRGDEAALTDFVPLAAGASPAPLDGGQVVRVEAPRAALASLGLPVDPRRANEKVKADLLLAHDGTAHAIRFVR